MNLVLLKLEVHKLHTWEHTNLHMLELGHSLMTLQILLKVLFLRKVLEEVCIRKKLCYETRLELCIHLPRKCLASCFLLVHDELLLMFFLHHLLQCSFLTYELVKLQR